MAHLAILTIRGLHSTGPDELHLQGSTMWGLFSGICRLTEILAWPARHWDEDEAREENRDENENHEGVLAGYIVHAEDSSTNS